MASYSYSTSSSDVSTPRSSSPASARSSNTSISYKRMSLSSRRMTDSNPMAGVDLATIEERIRTASLDQHRGYAKRIPAEVRQYRTAEYIPQSQALAYQVLREPTWNRGTYAVGVGSPISRPNTKPQQTPNAQTSLGEKSTLLHCIACATLLLQPALAGASPTPLLHTLRIFPATPPIYFRAYCRSFRLPTPGQHSSCVFNTAPPPSSCRLPAILSLFPWHQDSSTPSPSPVPSHLHALSTFHSTLPLVPCPCSVPAGTSPHCHHAFCS